MRDGDERLVGQGASPMETRAQERLAADLAHAILAADMLALPRTRAALAKALAILDAETTPAA